MFIMCSDKEGDVIKRVMCSDKEGDRFPDTPVSSISHVTGASLINQSIPFCPMKNYFHSHILLKQKYQTE